MITFDENETLITTVRKHIFVFLAGVAGPIFLALFPLAIIISLFYLSGIPGFESVVAFLKTMHPALFVFGYSLWLLLLWIRIYVVWTDYYLDSWFVTDKRIVDVEQDSFFSRNVSTISYDRIQDITVEVHGIIATHFDFGDLHVQSAGESREFVIRGIPHPYRVKEKITAVREKHMKAYNQADV